MVRSANSSGVNAARETSLLQRFTQYAQSNTHTLVMSTFSNVMQRPSGVKLWQQPAPMALPSSPFFEPRDTPDEVQATSHFAASASMVSFSNTSTTPPFNKHLYEIV